ARAAVAGPLVRRVSDASAARAGDCADDGRACRRGRRRVSDSPRHTSLDIARGLAVVGMIYMHLVPTEGAVSTAGRTWTGFAELLAGKSAALFCILAGTAWIIQAQRAQDSPLFPRYVVRRVLALALAGALFHLVWPTEILIPLALMMALALAARRAGSRVVAAALVLLLAAAPLVPALRNGQIAADWNPDGTHLMDTRPGWATVRAYLADGSYPIVPWLAFPLLGGLMPQPGLPEAGRAGRWAVIALLVAVPAQLWALWAGAHEESLGTFAPYVTATWVPTSIVFMLVAGGTATAVIAGLVAWDAGGGLPRPLLP